MTRLATKAFVIFAAMSPVAICAEVDPAALLTQARAKIVENIKRLPKYTCVQTVHRYRFQAVPAAHVNGCDQAKDASTDETQRRTIAWRDRFKLDVTVSQGAEIFSWVGAKRFQSGDVSKIVGGGMTGTGDFGPFLISIFGGDGAKYEYLDTEEDNGQSLAVYRYRVPLAASHYQVRVGPLTGDLATMAYEGKFWIDRQNAQLSRMTIEVPDPPRESETCRLETTIAYRLARIGRADFLLPQSTVLELWDVTAQQLENRIEYSACREFQSESVFRADPEPSHGNAESPRASVPIPPGATLKIALGTRIDSESSFAGDAIEGQLTQGIGKLVPKGAIVHGRIVHLEQKFLPAKEFSLGLHFYSVEMNGVEAPLTLTAVAGRGLVRLDFIGEREGIGTFMFEKDHVVLDQKFVSEWKTVGGK